MKKKYYLHQAEYNILDLELLKCFKSAESLIDFKRIAVFEDDSSAIIQQINQDIQNDDTEVFLLLSEADIDDPSFPINKIELNITVNNTHKVHVCVIDVNVPSFRPVTFSQNGKYQSYLFNTNFDCQELVHGEQVDEEFRKFLQIESKITANEQNPLQNLNESDVNNAGNQEQIIKDKAVKYYMHKNTAGKYDRPINVVHAGKVNWPPIITEFKDEDADIIEQINQDIQNGEEVVLLFAESDIRSKDPHKITKQIECQNDQNLTVCLIDLVPLLVQQAVFSEKGLYSHYLLNTKLNTPSIVQETDEIEKLLKLQPKIAENTQNQIQQTYDTGNKSNEQEQQTNADINSISKIGNKSKNLFSSMKLAYIFFVLGLASALACGVYLTISKQNFKWEIVFALASFAFLMLIVGVGISFCINKKTELQIDQTNPNYPNTNHIKLKTTEEQITDIMYINEGLDQQRKDNKLSQ